MFKHFGIMNSYTLESTFYAGMQKMANGQYKKRNIEPEN
jgi:predicted DNA-binding ribbon-helix-helix protein